MCWLLEVYQPFSKARGNWGGPQVLSPVPSSLFTLSPVSQSTLIIHSTLFPFNYDLNFNANCIFLCLKLFNSFITIHKSKEKQLNLRVKIESEHILHALIICSQHWIRGVETLFCLATLQVKVFAWSPF